MADKTSDKKAPLVFVPIYGPSKWDAREQVKRALDSKADGLEFWVGELRDKRVWHMMNICKGIPGADEKIHAYSTGPIGRVTQDAYIERATLLGEIAIRNPRVLIVDMGEAQHFPTENVSPMHTRLVVDYRLTADFKKFELPLVYDSYVVSGFSELIRLNGNVLDIEKFKSLREFLKDHKKEGKVALGTSGPHGRTLASLGFDYDVPFVVARPEGSTNLHEFYNGLPALRTLRGEWAISSRQS